jgi:hypothetical protein
MANGQKNIGEQGSKVQKTSMTKGRKNIGEHGSKIEKTSVSMVQRSKKHR